MKKLNKLLIKYEPVIRYLDVTVDMQVNSYNNYDSRYFEDVRFTGWTAVGKIEDKKMYIAFSVCKYEEGDKFVKKEGVIQALVKCTPEKATIIVDLTDVPENETVKVFHGYVDMFSEKLEKRFFKKKLHYWINK